MCHGGRSPAGNDRVVCIQHEAGGAELAVPRYLVARRDWEGGHDELELVAVGAVDISRNDGVDFSPELQTSFLIELAGDFAVIDGVDEAVAREKLPVPKHFLACAGQAGNVWDELTCRGVVSRCSRKRQTVQETQCHL